MSTRAVISRSLVLLAAAGMASSASAQAKKPAVAPAVMGQVLACQSIKDGAQRLACYDRQVAAMSRAQATGDLVAMDRQEVRRTKRSLFGIALPDLSVFGDDSIGENVSSLETTLKGARQNADGKWTFDLVEGGRWAQIDSREFIVDPRAGHPIRIRRAAMGSYLANVNKQIAVRVRRVH